MQYGNRGIFHHTAFSVVAHFLPKKKEAWFFPDKVDMGRVGVGVGVRARVRIRA